MYGTKDVKDDVRKPMFPVGISDNAQLDKVAYENSKPDGTGKNVLAFHFISENGGQFRKIFWEVDPQRVITYNQKYPKTAKRDNAKLGITKGQTITDEQAVALEFETFNRNIKHIMTKYMSEDEATLPPVNSYEEFAKAVIKKMTGKYEGKLMRIKTVFNNNYLDFPRFGAYLEPMTVDKKDTTLFINVSYDNLKRESASTESEVESAVTADGPTNDLPF